MESAKQRMADAFDKYDKAKKSSTNQVLKKEYNRIFRKVLFQVLLDPTKANLFNNVCDRLNKKPSAVLRTLAYRFIRDNEPNDYILADDEDQRLSDKAQQSRIDNGFNWTKQ